MYGFSLRMGEYIWTIENWPRELFFFFFPWWKIPPNRVENESYSRKTVTCEILVFYFQMDSHPEGINIFESKILEIYHRKLFFINVLHLELLLGLIFYNYQKCFDSQLLKYAINWKKIEKSRHMSVSTIQFEYEFKVVVNHAFWKQLTERKKKRAAL